MSIGESSIMKKVIYYATTNTGKFDEVKRYINKHEPSIDLLPFTEDLPEIQTTDQRVIAIDKANQAWQALKKPVLVDDSGIYFDHYNNFPGTLSKYVFYGIGFEGILKLTENDNRATMRLFMIYKESDQGYEIFEGITKGKIVHQTTLPSHPSLPYDAIFMPDGADKVMGLIRGTDEEKKYAYRLKALQKFLEWYKAR
jgi:XTP/dITP diphosphohydrolase